MSNESIIRTSNELFEEFIETFGPKNQEIVLYLSNIYESFQSDERIKIVLNHIAEQKKDKEYYEKTIASKAYLKENDNTSNENELLKNIHQNIEIINDIIEHNNI